jgi:DNA-binding ferritin-like protein (Dps family)
MTNDERWQEVADFYQTLPEEQKREWNNEFRQILQEEIDKEVIRKIPEH